MGILRFGDLDIWEYGIPKNPKLKILKIKICVVQNVGKVWMSREKIPLVPFGAISNIFPQARKM